jgi:digeranylgeranylglycerophospholipid reductase
MSSNKEDYDIIVAGGGLAGMIVAYSAAYYSKQSLRILVVDRNPLSVVGKKTITGWVCGDTCQIELISNGSFLKLSIL